jgi:predicted RNA-binding protein with RPS1 domain
MSIIIILITDASRIGLSIKEESDQEEQAAAEEKQKKNISTI